jgi:hypothetical protein
MQVAQFSMKPLTDHFPVTHNDSSHKRIRADLPAPKLRKLKSPLQVFTIRSFKRGVHVD